MRLLQNVAFACRVISKCLVVCLLLLKEVFVSCIVSESELFHYGLLPKTVVALCPSQNVIVVFLNFHTGFKLPIIFFAFHVVGRSGFRVLRHFKMWVVPLGVFACNSLQHPTNEKTHTCWAWRNSHNNNNLKKNNNNNFYQPAMQTHILKRRNTLKPFLQQRRMHNNSRFEDRMAFFQFVWWSLGHALGIFEHVWIIVVSLRGDLGELRW